MQFRYQSGTGETTGSRRREEAWKGGTKRKRWEAQEPRDRGSGTGGKGEGQYERKDRMAYSTYAPYRRQKKPNRT
jgi:hypothetical protein